MRTLGFVAIAIMLAHSSSAFSQSRPEYVAVAMHIDQVMDPKNIFDVARDCQNNNLCAGALSAISTLSGSPFVAAVAVAATLSRTNFGEGNGFTIGLPSGYRYCSAHFSLTSIVPHDGDRGSRILLRADDAGLYAETWTPVMPFGQGRSWVEGNITVVGVRADLAERSYGSAWTPCYNGNSRNFFWCRGGGCEGQVVDRGKSIDMASGPPGAGQRRE